MSKINADIEYVIGEAQKAEDSLNILQDNIEKISREYKDLFGEQKSDEFIKEFKESIGELIDQSKKVTAEYASSIIESIEDVAKVYEEVDEETSNSIKG